MRVDFKRAVDFDGQLMLIHGKGNKERYVPFGHYAKDALQTYLKVAREPLMQKYHKTHEVVFINHYGDQLHPRVWNTFWIKWLIAVVWRVTFIRICCGIPLPRIYWITVRIYGPYKSFWATAVYPQLRSILTWLSRSFSVTIGVTFRAPLMIKESRG